MSKEFEKLIELEKSRQITIGLDRNHSNNFWSRTTKIGKLLNLMTPIFIIITILLFLKVGVAEGFAALFITAFYSLIVQKFAVWYARSKLLKEEVMFEAAYEAHSATLRDNNGSEVIRYPTDWRVWVTDR